MDVEYWPTPELTVARGNREPILSAYRCVRDGLLHPHQAALRSGRRADGLGRHPEVVARKATLTLKADSKDWQVNHSIKSCGSP